MSGNASKEVSQIAEFLGSLGKAAALVAPRMTTQARQSWIGMPPGEFARILEELVFLPRRWREQDGAIYLSVTSDGTTGPQWIERLEKKGFQLAKWEKDILRSSDFTPTNGVTYEIAVLKGGLFTDGERTTRNIRVDADRRGWTKPNAEVACLIREQFSDEEIEAMGLWWIVAMHEPIKDSDGDLDLLGASRRGGGRRLDAFCDGPGRGWHREDGFAFVVSQVGS